MKHVQSADWTAGSDPTTLHNELTGVVHNCWASVKKHPLWKGTNEEEIENALESIEKFLTSKLYERSVQ